MKYSHIKLYNLITTEPKRMKKSSQRRSPAIKWLWIVPLVALLDQLSKSMLIHHLQFGESKTLLPFLNLALTLNTGAAFSFLNQAGGWQIFLFAGTAIIALIVLFFWLLKTPEDDKLTSVAICLVMGGALGNLIDRFQHGFVIDFIDFHIKGWHFATFNIADSAVSIGAVLLLWHLLRGDKRK